MSIRSRIDGFYAWLPAWVRHSLTTLLSVTTAVLGICFAFTWLMGLFPSWVGVVASGYRPELAEGTTAWFAMPALYLGVFYIYTGWAFYLAGAVLIPLGWLLQAIALKWPSFHWASRLASAAALLMFGIPLAILAIQMILMKITFTLAG